MTPASVKARPKILLEIYKDIVAGNLHIPVLPAVALKVRDSGKNPNQSIAELTQLILADTALTAYLLKVANSSFFSRINKSKTLLQAVNRLGQNKTRDLAVTYCIKTLFTSRQPGVKDILRRQWERSARIAAIASVLASHCKGIDTERALLAGLLQDIGSLPIIDKMSSYLAELNSDNAVDETLSRYSRTVGAIVLEKWNFDQDLIDVVQSSEQWQRECRDLDLSDVILIARLHSYVGTTRMKQLPNINEIPAFRRFNVLQKGELNPEVSLELLENAKEEIQELYQNLL
jgi:HD-like signal output (HDOD) protein